METARLVYGYCEMITSIKRIGRWRKSKQQLISNNPAILALGRALDRYGAAADGGSGKESCREGFVDLITSHLPKNCVKPVFLPANGASPPSLAAIFSPEFHQYVAFAAEYLAAFTHSDTNLEGVDPNQRIARMRDSFEKDKRVLADDYAYLTTPRESIRPNKVEHKSAGRNERRSPEQSETLSSDKSDD
jgi:hypothetical protein